jgi:hypothetical protein
MSQHVQGPTTYSHKCYALIIHQCAILKSFEITLKTLYNSKGSSWHILSVTDLYAAQRISLYAAGFKACIQLLMKINAMSIAD